MTQELKSLYSATHVSTASLLRYSKVVSLLHLRHCHTLNGIMHSLRKCLAIVFGCQRFDQYLAQKDKIVLETDQKPLEPIFKKPIHAVPCHLQRMLLRLLHYNLDVIYKKGSLMYLADHLSRAPLVQENESKEPDEFQVFASELESMSLFDAIKLSPERLVQLQTCAAQDPVLMTLKTTVITAWPELRKQVPIPIREHWLY